MCNKTVRKIPHLSFKGGSKKIKTRKGYKRIKSRRRIKTRQNGAGAFKQTLQQLQGYLSIIKGG